MVFQGKKGRSYTLNAKIGGGGEGDVYTIVGMPHLLAKIYHQNHFHSASARTEMQQKIDAMLMLNNSHSNHLIIAWPIDALYDSAGVFQGYVMPKASSKTPILCAFIPTERRRLFPDYTWAYAPRIAFNLAVSVALLHEKSGLTIGDMNTENFLIDGNGLITLIDVDSYNITSNGKCYKCKAGVPDMLAPELQGKDLSLPTTQFTLESDRFSLAVLIFQILVNGIHPFGMPNTAVAGQSSGRNAVVTNIASGYCPYVTGATGNCNIETPNMDMFPQYIRELFDRAFKYTPQTAIKKETIAQRPSAREWAVALRRLIDEGTQKCPKDSHHTYPKTYTGICPWCEVKKRQATLVSTKQFIPHQNTTPTCASPHLASKNTYTQPINRKARTAYQVAKRKPLPLYLLYPVSGCIGALLMSSEFTRLSQSMEGLSLSESTACGVLALVGIFVGIILARLVENFYIKSDFPGLWVALSVVVPIFSFIGTALLLVGLYIAIAVLVLILICSIFANM